MKIREKGKERGGLGAISKILKFWMTIKAVLKFVLEKKKLV